MLQKKFDKLHNLKTNDLVVINGTSRLDTCRCEEKE
jgi:hypothetical protein